MDALPLGANRPDAMAAFAGPRAREIHEFVLRAPTPVGRDEVADALGLPRSTAAFHLDKLVDAQILRATHRRLTGRSGPGAGRPTKLYAPAATEIVASSPERHYELAGDILAEAAAASDRDGVPMSEALGATARATGERIGRTATTLQAALSACGYAPREEPGGTVTLDNCPFHRLAARHTALICTTNLALVEGIAIGCRDPRTPALAPREGHCCVELRAASDPDGDTGMSAES